jgi:hypothetical protein
MPTLLDTNDLLDDTISGIVQDFNKGTLSTEKNVFNEVLGLIKGLDVGRDGNLKQTNTNFKILNSIRAKIEPVVLNDAYKKRVTKYMTGFTDVQKINNEYLGTIAESFKPNAVLQKQILSYEMEVTANSLVGAGIEAEVIDPVKKLIQNAVVSGGGYGDLVGQLRDDIKGIPDIRGGSLSRYTNQIATDAMNQYSRNYVQAISNDLDFEWFYYSGGIKSTSRRYCKKRSGRHFHKKEIEKSSHLKWSGKSKGTNESSIFTLCGGYNCGHRYLPVDEDQVPKRVKRRVSGEKAEKQPEFKPAKTIKEAEDWATRNNIKINMSSGIGDAQKLEILNSAKKSSHLFENRFGVKFGDKINFGREYGDLPFVKEIKTINNASANTPLAEYMRVESTYSTGDSLFINLGKVVKEVDFKDNIYSISNNKTPLYNVKDMTDVFNHEAAHNFYFGHSIKKIKAFKEVFEKKNLWEIAPSFYGQENASEFFAEAMVNVLRGEKSKATEIITKHFDL